MTSQNNMHRKQGMLCTQLMVTGQTGIQPLLSHANVPAQGKSQPTGGSPGRVWGRGQNGGVGLAGNLPPPVVVCW